MQPVIAANRAEAERLRRLPYASARAFVDASLHRVLLPEDLGGEALSPIDQFDRTCILRWLRCVEFLGK
jgi:hypothetical protein